MRGSMIEVLGTNYVRTARSKGLAESRVVIRHVLRNAMVPVVTGPLRLKVTPTRKSFAVRCVGPVHRVWTP